MRSAPRSAPRSARALPLVLVLAACAAPPAAPPADPDAKPTLTVTEGAIRMPPGVDLDRLRLLDEGRQTKVYVETLSIGDDSNPRLLFPRQMAEALNLSNRQVTRRFVDTIAKSRRFEVYDIGSSVTADQSDYVIDSVITSAIQELVPSEGGTRLSMTRVRLSVQMKNRYTGELVLPTGLEAVGQTGRSTGDRVVLTAVDRVEDPQVQRRLANDYERALQRAFNEAARRIEEVVRPLGRVLSADGNAVGIVGGMRHGLQPNDRLVVFRAQTTTLGGRDVVARTTPVAVVTCDGVGTLTSQCDVTRRNPQFKVQAGDYAVLTDESLFREVRFQ